MLVNEYSDAGWVGCIEDRRSTCGFAIFLGNSLVSWNANKQTKVKYKALINTAAEIIWILTLLKELQIRGPPHAKVWVNNMGAKYLSFNSIFHDRMKHIKVNYHFIRDHVAKRLDYVPTGDQTVDGFTKKSHNKKISSIILT
jgi:hypothetical protein